MRCAICGAEIAENSIYCKKCGNKIQNQSITLENLREEISELKETGRNQEVTKYYDTLLKTLSLREFGKVTYIYEPLFPSVEKTIENMIDEEGNLRIYKIGDEELLKLIGALIQNEVEGIHETLASISKGQHNDRIAQVEAAKKIYTQALLTENREIQIQLLSQSMSSLQEGVSKLKSEMKENLELFQRLPKSAIKKLFCGISPRRAYAALDDIREGFDCYVNSVGLLIGINAGFGDRDAKKRVKCSISEENEFLSEVKISNGYKRLLEIDDENTHLWEKKITVLQIALQNMVERIETGKITLKIEGKDNE